MSGLPEEKMGSAGRGGGSGVGIMAELLSAAGGIKVNYFWWSWGIWGFG
jgi:hypothetical protein